ncbi:MAG: hypothetical protein GX111_13880 [Clostridiales bacterium]|nr:hypothetical protein [Clostridiales bacterium]
MVRRKSRSGRWLLLAVLLLACLFFALASAICVRIFADSRKTVDDSVNLSYAITAAISGVEVFKAAGGDREQTADTLGARLCESGIRLFYDDRWQRTGESDRRYTMEILWQNTDGALVYARVIVSGESDGVLFALNTAVLRDR